MTSYERLEELYATLPTVQCQRKCSRFCGQIVIPKIEARRLEEKRGYLATQSPLVNARLLTLPCPEVIEREYVGLKPEIPPFDGTELSLSSVMKCVFLERTLGSCLAYKIRPLVCRLWGCIDDPLTRCPHGCVPTKWVTNLEARDLFRKVVDIQRGE